MMVGQAPNAEGVRETRFAIVRNSYQQLESTTLVTWKQWISEKLIPIKYGPPIIAEGEFRLPDGTLVRTRVDFLALDREEDAGKIDSLELTAAWVNEGRHVPVTIAVTLNRRCGRFPRACDGGPTRTGVIMDTNPPSDKSWWYDYAEHGGWKVDGTDGVPGGSEWAFFRQPGGLIYETEAGKKGGRFRENPLAENIDNLPGKWAYYWAQTQGSPLPLTLGMVCGQYLMVYEGRAVYEGVWRDDWHVAEAPLKAYDGLPLILGVDFGLTPAVVVGQMSPRGQLRILRERWTERDGIRQFALGQVIPLLRNEYPGHSFYAIADPSGGAGQQVDVNLTCIGEMNSLNIPTEAARTNDFIPRRDAVMFFLNRVTDGQPAFLLDPSCKLLRQGMNGAYHFAKVRATGEQYQDRPEKNVASHVAEALQYLALGAMQGARNEAVLVSAPVIHQVGWGAYT